MFGEQLQNTNAPLIIQQSGELSDGQFLQINFNNSTLPRTSGVNWR